MGDGSGQSLLFVVVMVAWVVLSFLEAQARKRQQRERMEEMEREEAAEGSDRLSDVAAGPWERARQGTATGAGTVEPGTWERPGGDAPAAPENAPAETWEAEAARAERWEPEPWEPPTPWEGRAPDAELEPTELAREAERLREESRREVREADAASPAPPDRERRPRREEAAEPPPAPSGHRAAGPPAAALRRALRGDPHALRDAVLYREILGRPLGSRPGPGGWEEPAG